MAGKISEDSAATSLVGVQYAGIQSGRNVRVPQTLFDAEFMTSAEVSASFQPLDADLTEIAALTTTSFGRGLLTEADAASARSTLGAVRPFETIADAQSETWVTAPDTIQTRGHTTAGDGGGALYKKAASEPSHAGKFSITLSDGVTVVWYELATDRPSPLMFGAVPFDDDTAVAAANTTAVQAFLDYMAARTLAADEGNAVEGVWGSEIFVDDTVLMRNAESMALPCGRLTAISTFPANEPVLRIEGTAARAKVSIIVDGGKVAAGIDVIAGRCDVTRCLIFHFQDYGVQASGTSGDTYITRNEISQWVNSDDEFTSDANYTADGIRIGRADQKVFDNTVRWCGCNFRAADGAGTTNVKRNHFYNGGSGVLVRANPKNIIVEAGAGNIIFSENYLDNGEIDLFSDSVSFDGNSALYNPTACTLDYFISVFANGVNNPFRFASSPWRSISSGLSAGDIPFIQFVDNGEDSWSGDYDDVNAVLPGALVRIGNQEQVIVSTGASNSELLSLTTPRVLSRLAFKHTGWTTSAPEIAGFQNRLEARVSSLMVYDPNGTGGALDLVSSANYGINSDGSALKFKANGADRWEIVSSAVLRPVAAGTNLGSTSNRIGTVYSQNAADVSSDVRLKEDIEVVPETDLEAAKLIRGLIRRYKMKDGDGRWHYGVVAQEVEAALKATGIDPRSVGFLNFNDGEDDDGMMSIAYDDLQMLLLAAL